VGDAAVGAGEAAIVADPPSGPPASKRKSKTLIFSVS
jgi:hypothetical protein